MYVCVCAFPARNYLTLLINFRAFIHTLINCFSKTAKQMFNYMFHLLKGLRVSGKKPTHKTNSKIYHKKS